MKMKLVKLVKQMMYFTLVLALVLSTMPAQSYVYASEETQQDTSDEEEVDSEEYEEEASEVEEDVEEEESIPEDSEEEETSEERETSIETVNDIEPEEESETENEEEQYDYPQEPSIAFSEDEEKIEVKIVCAFGDSDIVNDALKDIDIRLSAIYGEDEVVEMEDIILERDIVEDEQIQYCYEISKRTIRKIIDKKDEEPEKFAALKKLYGNSFKVKVTLSDNKNHILNRKELKTEEITLHKFETELDRIQDQKEISFSDSITKEQAQAWQTKNTYGATLKMEECTENGEAVFDGYFAKSADNDVLYPKRVGSAFVKLMYGETTFFQEAYVIVPVKIEQIELEKPVFTNVQDDNSADSRVKITVGYKKFQEEDAANYNNVNRAIQESTLQLIALDHTAQELVRISECGHFTYSINETDTEIIFSYVISKDKLENITNKKEDWEELQKLYDKEYILQAQFTGKNGVIKDREDKSEDKYQLSYEDCPLSFEVTGIQKYPLDLTPQGKIRKYKIKANSFWQALGYKYDFQIKSCKGNSVRASVNKRNQSLDITMMKTGTTKIQVYVPKQFFWKEKTLEIVIQVDSPVVSDDLMLFTQEESNDQSAKTWEKFTQTRGSVYGDSQQGYWSRYPVRLTMNQNDLYYNQFYMDGVISASNPVDTYVFSAEKNNKMSEHVIRVINENLDTFNTVKYKFAIDDKGPVRKSEIPLIGEHANYEDAIYYYNTKPVINIQFEDKQSGLFKTTVTYKKDGVLKTADFTQPLTLEDGVYDYIYFTGIDHVGNETQVKVCDGKKIIVDTVTPAVTANMHVSGHSYAGNWVNQQIQYIVTETEDKHSISGIKSVQYVYVPYGKSYDDIKAGDWKTIKIDGNGRFTGSIGESDWPVNTLHDNEIAKDAEKATAIIGVSSDEKHVDSSANTISAGKLQNGTYYFKATSRALLTGTRQDIESYGKKVRLQQRELQPGSAYISRKPAGTNWYNASMTDEKPYLSVSYPAIKKISGKMEYPSLVTLHYEIRDIWSGKVCSTMAFKAGCVENGDMVDDFMMMPTSGYLLEDDGRYEIYVWTTDEAGNRSKTEKYHADVDYTAPTDLKIYVNDEDITEEKLDGTISYRNFFKSSVDIKVSADFDISGYGNLKVCEARNPGDINKSGGNWHSIGKSEGSFTVSPNKRCYYHMVAIDQAGNEAEVRSQGIVVDNEAPIGMNETDFTIEPIGANANGFFNRDFDVDIKVQDSPTDHDSAALKEVTYVISDSKDHTKSEKLFSFGNASASYDQLSKAEKFEDTVRIDAADYESNTAYLEVIAMDNSGNERRSQKPLQIDVTLPEITVTYDNNDALHDSYYKQNRTARVNIHELNFDPKDVAFEITKNGVPFNYLTPGLESWHNDGEDHYTYITFSEDGDYTVTLSYTDLADNDAVYDTVDVFTIDKTSPTVTVSYDNDTPWKEFYFNRARTATITIVEHNFDAADFKLTALPVMPVGNWTHDGDIHTTTITFSEDGEYTYSFEYMDLAGNMIEKPAEEHFKIDTVEPVITINGVEDGSANAGEVVPAITVEDEDFDAEGVKIALRTSLGSSVEIKKAANVMENGCQYTLPDVTEQKDAVYYLTVMGTDLAGNTSELTYRFSLNRHGSTYDLINLSDLADKVYVKYQDVSDLEIYEMNIDTIDKFSIYISRNGMMLDSRESSVSPSGDSDTICYKVVQKGNADTGYTYTYTLYKENFEKEGLYNIMLYSKDRAGNEVNNTLTEKGAAISFVVDNTAPNVVIQGVEGNALYVEDSLNVNVIARDNFKLKKAEFYLLDREGNRTMTWDYLKKAGGEDKPLTLTLPSSEHRQSLLFYAVDEAGNEILSLQDEEDTPTSFLITTNPWLRFINSTKEKTVAGLVVGSMASITALIVFLRRRKKII